MASLATRAFGALAAGAAFIASPALAQDSAAPANQNTSAELQPVTFATFDDRSRSERFVMAGAAQASHDKIAIIVWGGNRALQQEAYNAALDLRDQGIPVAFILGPGVVPVDTVASFQVYAGGRPMYEGYGSRIGSGHLDVVRPTVERMGREAYREAFTSQVAALDLE